MRDKGLLVVSLVLAAALAASAQQQGGGGGGGKEPTGGGGGRSDRGQGGPQGQQQDTFGNRQDPFGQQQQRYRPVFLSGQVLLDDGSPPPEAVTIERICNGQRTPETYTDRKGRFSFQLGGDPTLAMSDASSSGFPGGAGFGRSPGNFGGAGGFAGGGRSTGLGQVDLTGCELRADLPGYRSDALQLGRRSVFDRPDVGVIILHRMGNVQGHSVSVTTLAAPKKAQKAYEKAAKELRKKDPRRRKPENAIKELEKAVAEYPKYAAAWTLLGQTKVQMNDPNGAREAFHRALQADPKYLKPYGPLLQLELQQGRWQEVSGLSGKLLKLNPTLTNVHYYRAVASFNLGNLDESEKAANAVQSSREAARFPQVHHLLGAIHAKKGNFPLAATEYRSFVEAQPDSPAATKLKRQLMEWEALGVIQKQGAIASK